MDLLNINNIFNELIFKGGVLFCIVSSLYDCFEVHTDTIKPFKSHEDMYLYLAKGDSTPGSPTRDPVLSNDSPKSEWGSRSNTPVRENVNDSFTPSEVAKVLAENHRFGQLIMKYFYEQFLPDYTKEANELKSINDVPMKISLDVPTDNKINTSKEELSTELINICMFHAERMMKACELRIDFVSRVEGFLPEEERNYVNGCIDEILAYRTEYADRIERIKGTGSNELKPLIKQFFDNTNWYRNTGLKEFNYIDMRLRYYIRDSHMYRNNPEFKRMIQVDYPLAVKTFNDQDNYLKRKINEALNKPVK